MATQLRSGAIKVGDLLTELKEHTTCIPRGTCTLAQRRRIGLTLIALGTAMTMLVVAAKLRSRSKSDDEQFLVKIKKNDPALSEEIIAYIAATKDAEVLHEAEAQIGSIANYKNRAAHLIMINARRHGLARGTDVSPADFLNPLVGQAAAELTRDVPLPAPIGEGIQVHPPAAPIPVPFSFGVPAAPLEPAQQTLRPRAPSASKLRRVQLTTKARKDFTDDEQALIKAATKKDTEAVRDLLKKGLEHFSLKAIQIAYGNATKRQSTADDDDDDDEGESDVVLQRLLLNARTNRSVY